MMPNSSVFWEISKWLNEIPDCRRVDVRAPPHGVVCRLSEETEHGTLECSFQVSGLLADVFRGDLLSITFREAAKQLQRAVDRVERDEEPTIQVVYGPASATAKGVIE